MSLLKSLSNECPFHSFLNPGKVSLPSYQRSYKYDETNWSMFWEEINEVAKAGPREMNFDCGFVCVLEEQIDGNMVYSFIDGQQRFFTCLIFLFAIYETAKRLGVHLEELNIRSSLFGTQVRDRYPLFFSETSPKSDQQEKALAFFLKELGGVDGAGSPEKTLQALQRKIEETIFITRVVKDRWTASKYFDKLNSGKPLTAGERAKGALWDYDSAECDNCWDKIESHFSPALKRDPTKFFLTFLRRLEAPVEKKNLASVLRGVLSEYGRDHEKFFSLLLHTAKWMSYIENPANYKGKTQIKKALDANRFLSHSDAHHSLLITVLSGMEDIKMKDEVAVNFVRLIQRVFIRVPFVEGNPVKTFGTLFPKAGHNVTIDYAGAFLADLEIRFSRALNEAENSFESKKGNPLGGMNRLELLYLSIYVKEKFGYEVVFKGADKNREHIFPRSAKIGVSKRWIESIGNKFVLDGNHNRTMTNKSFEEKRTCYVGCGPVAQNIAESETWGVNEIQARQVEILNVVNKVFPRFI